MSEALRVAVIAEGKTDRLIIEAAVWALLADRRYILVLLQPEEPSNTAPFGPTRPRPGGWGGVFEWCKEMRTRAGRLSEDQIKTTYDVVLVHLDADVAEKTYQSAHINQPLCCDLPCAHPCPPVNATTNALRAVALNWLGEATLPSWSVFCIPSKSIETWAAAALYPDDQIVASGDLECRSSPESILKSKPAGERLISGDSKKLERYEAKVPEIKNQWPTVRQLCFIEAERFSREFLSAVSLRDSRS